MNDGSTTELAKQVYDELQRWEEINAEALTQEVVNKSWHRGMIYQLEKLQVSLAEIFGDAWPGTDRDAA